MRWAGRQSREWGCDHSGSLVHIQHQPLSLTHCCTGHPRELREGHTASLGQSGAVGRGLLSPDPLLFPHRTEIRQSKHIWVVGSLVGRRVGPLVCSLTASEGQVTGPLSAFWHRGSQVLGKPNTAVAASLWGLLSSSSNFLGLLLPSQAGIPIPFREQETGQRKECLSPRSPFD